MAMGKVRSVPKKSKSQATASWLRDISTHKRASKGWPAPPARPPTRSSCR